MERIKPSRNNPNPIPFVQIKSEPQLPAEKENIPTIRAEQPDIIILNVSSNQLSNRNNPNPVQFQIKQEATAYATENVYIDSTNNSTTVNNLVCKNAIKTDKTDPIIIVSVSQNHVPHRNNSNPVQFQIKQETTTDKSTTKVINKKNNSIATLTTTTREESFLVESVAQLKKRIKSLAVEKEIERNRSEINENQATERTTNRIKKAWRRSAERKGQRNV